MPFLLYKRSDNDMRRVKKVSLGGKHGPFARHVQRLLDDGAEAPIEWHMDSRAILHQLGVDTPGDHALIVNLKPKAEGNVSLYRITDAWGHTKAKWTPLGLRMEMLFVDREEPDPDRFQERFQVPPGDGDLVHEFLYLTGGAKKDRWMWGRTGTVNAALLWPDTFRYFVEAMTADLDWEPSLH